MATIYERVRKVTIAQLDVTEEQVGAASGFVSDLGADSLDLVELIMALEEEFTTPEKRVSIPDEDVEKIVTVQDAVEYLRKLGVSDYQAPPKPVEKSGPRLSLPRPPQAKPITTKPIENRGPAVAPGQTPSNPSRRKRHGNRRGGNDRRENRPANNDQTAPRPVRPSINPPGGAVTPPSV